MRSERSIGPELAGRTLGDAVDPRAIREGRVFVDGKRARSPKLALVEGMRLVVHAPAPSEALAPLSVIFEDERILVIDKAPGDHLNETETSARPALAERLPGTFVVHRLDRETSGVVALAKSARVAAELSAAFAERRVEKRYLALVAGAIEDGELEGPIGLDKRRPRARRVRADGQPAHTSVRVLSRAEGLAAVAASPHTGRTHQIRVHLSHAGAPILGDRLYGGPMVVRLGGELLELPRVMLHAARLALPGWPAFVAPIPADLRAVAGHGLALEGLAE